MCLSNTKSLSQKTPIWLLPFSGESSHNGCPNRKMFERPARNEFKGATRLCLPISALNALTELLKQHLSISALKQVHAQVVVQSLSSYPPLISSLIHRYLPLQRLTSARLLFDNYPSSVLPPCLLWNLIIRAHSKSRNSLDSIRYFSRMLAVGWHSMVRPDDYTYTFTLTSCSYQTWPGYGLLVHGLIIRNGFESGVCVGNAMINMYSVFGYLSSARKVFDQMSERDVFSWTSLLGGYCKHGDIYSACEIFDRMPVKNDVSWGVMISGLVSNEKYLQALNYFRCMLADAQVKPNEVAIVCALSACSHLGALDFGNWIQSYVDRCAIGASPNICTSLIDMYAKCGRIDCARRIFSKIRKPNVHNYTSMITGLSIHGLSRDALDLFYGMMDEGVMPNEITILGVLNGCSHSGLVEEGTKTFNNMERLWGCRPKLEHYGAYVDLLGRAGRLEKALEVVKSMPMEPDIVIWRALLSACRIHRNINLGEQIINHVHQHDSDVHTNGNVLLSNLYASLGKWEDVSGLRKLMGYRMNNASNLGCSWFELNGVIHEFRVDDQLHPQILEIREKLNEILQKASQVGYAVSIMQVNFDLSEEDKQQAMARHSEKIAVAFALLNTPPGSFIRIVKNLRTCQDCHSAIKAISLAYDREIVVRDRCRFHTFKAGRCSCNDYW